jgi:hypothetical protein
MPKPAHSPTTKTTTKDNATIMLVSNVWRPAGNFGGNPTGPHVPGKWMHPEGHAQFISLTVRDRSEFREKPQPRKMGPNIANTVIATAPTTSAGSRNSLVMVAPAFLWQIRTRLQSHGYAGGVQIPGEPVFRRGRVHIVKCKKANLSASNDEKIGNELKWN